MLSARDVEEALRDRILRGAHPPGSPLPSVRTNAAELGASPSTVGRALQELARQGWVGVTNRRGTVVSRELPAGETGGRDVEAAVRRLAATAAPLPSWSAPWPFLECNRSWCVSVYRR